MKTKERFNRILEILYGFFVYAALIYSFAFFNVKKNSLIFRFLFFICCCNEIHKYVSTTNAYAHN